LTQKQKDDLEKNKDDKELCSIFKDHLLRNKKEKEPIAIYNAKDPGSILGY
jgi:hypothetical protein